MPTDVISKIGATNTPTTMDYSTLQAWEDAAPANLVTDDKRWIGECYDQGEFTGATQLLDINGITVDATRYVILRCATGASFRDKGRSSALYYNSSNGVAIRSTGGYLNGVIRCRVDYTQLRGLQLKSSATSTQTFYNELNAQQHIVVDGCLMEGAATGGFGPSIRVQGTWTNCLIVSLSTGTGACNGVGTAIKMYGCTIVAPNAATGRAFTDGGYAGSPTFQNCAFFGFATVTDAGSPSGSYNATDLSSVGFGTNNQVSLTFANQFTSSTNDFRAISTGSLDLNGTPDLTNLPVDISNTARSASTPTIGCWEFVASVLRVWQVAPQGQSVSPVVGSIHEVAMI